MSVRCPGQTGMYEDLHGAMSGGAVEPSYFSFLLCYLFLQIRVHHLVILGFSQRTLLLARTEGQQD